MFEVGRRAVARLESIPAGPLLAAALAEVDTSDLADGEHVDTLVALARQAAHAQAQLLAGTAAVGRCSAGPGFDSDEVAFALHLTRRGAQNQVALAQDLLGRLPTVWAALDRGDLCLTRARVFSDVLIVASDELAREIAERILPLASEWTAGQLRARLKRELITADPSLAKERYERSITERRVDLIGNDDTTACLSGIFLPPAKAAAAYERVDALARGLKRDGDTRTLDQLRADMFCELLAGVDVGASPIARPGVVELLVPLETLTGQSDAPGHLAGYGPVIADIARQVATQQAAQQEATRAAATRWADRVEAATSDQAAAVPAAQWRFRVYGVDGRLVSTGITRARPDYSQLFDAVDAAARPHAYRYVPVATGVLGRRPAEPCPPQPSDPQARFPDASTRRWIAARDTTCRAPGCTAAARICDVDHTIDHAEGGPTDDHNLGLLCRHHHRLKHEGGHRLHQIAPGHFVWESPNGRWYTTDPDPPVT